MSEFNDNIVKVGFFIAAVGLLFPFNDTFPILAILGSVIVTVRILKISKDLIFKIGVPMLLLGLILFSIGSGLRNVSIFEVAALIGFLGAGLISFRRYFLREAKLTYLLSSWIFIVALDTFSSHINFTIHALAGYVIGFLINLITFRKKTKAA